MRIYLRWILAACCVVAFAGAAPDASAAQGKGKGQSKQVQQDNKNKNKNKGAKGAEPKGNDRRDDDARRNDNVRRNEDQMRFAGMDRNGNGVITRDEWSGNDVSFANHDWDGNGRLEDDEVRPGATKPGRGNDNERADRWDNNRDGVISRSEWRGTSEAFDRLDINRDGVLSRRELPPVARP